MSINKTHDVFIAYHGSYDPSGSPEYADKLYGYLTSRGLNCFYFPVTGNGIYKANIIEVLRSRTFVLVTTNGLHTTESGRIDSKFHYELSTEIDAFYATSQIDEASVSDAAVLACGDYRKGDEARLHELFANRTHFFHGGDDCVFTDIYNWIMTRIADKRTWQNMQHTSEIKDVFATRSAMHQSCRLDDLIASAKNVRVVGISNSEMTARINPFAISNCIDNGGTVEILFLDPYGKFTALREEEESLRSGRIKSITETNIETAFDMRLRVKHPENFKLMIYDKQPRMNMIFTDNHLILQYYANNVPGWSNPTFFIEHLSNSPIWDFCEKVYEYLKSDAKEAVI